MKQSSSVRRPQKGWRRGTNIERQPAARSPGALGTGSPRRLNSRNPEACRGTAQGSSINATPNTAQESWGHVYIIYLDNSDRYSRRRRKRLGGARRPLPRKAATWTRFVTIRTHRFLRAPCGRSREGSPLCPRVSEPEGLVFPIQEITRIWSKRRCFWILPRALRGRSSTTLTSRGRL